MKNLTDYQNEFSRIKKIEGIKQRNFALVNLMNELEKKHHTFIHNPTQSELDKPEIILYREVSKARIF